MSIFDKLTDSKQYTGAHKHRFDESGRGRGLAGRDGGAFNGNAGPSGMGAVHLRPTLTSGATSARVGRPEAGKFGNNEHIPVTAPNSRPKSPGAGARGPTVADPYGAGAGRPLFRPAGETDKQDSSRTPRSGRRAAGAGGGGSIFDRLTDSSLYTGAHRERFDSDGKGKGLAGRDMGGEYSMGGNLHLRPRLGKM